MVRKLSILLVVCLLVSGFALANEDAGVTEIPREVQDFVNSMDTVLMENWSVDMGASDVAAFSLQEEDGYGEYLAYLGMDYVPLSGDRTMYDALYAVKLGDNGWDGVITIAYWNGQPTAYFYDGFAIQYVGAGLYLNVVDALETVLASLYPDAGYISVHDPIVVALSEPNDVGLGLGLTDYGDCVVAAAALDQSVWMFSMPGMSVQVYTAEWIEHLETTPEEFRNILEPGILMTMKAYLEIFI